MENRIYMRTLSVRLFFRTEILTYGNINIKKSLIRFCDTDKNRTDKVHRINNSHTWKRNLSLSSLISSIKFCLRIPQAQYIRVNLHGQTAHPRSSTRAYSHLKYEPRREKSCFSHMRTTKVQISLRIREV